MRGGAEKDGRKRKEEVKKPKMKKKKKKTSVNQCGNQINKPVTTGLKEETTNVPPHSPLLSIHHTTDVPSLEPSIQLLIHSIRPLLHCFSLVLPPPQLTPLIIPKYRTLEGWGGGVVSYPVSQLA